MGYEIVTEEVIGAPADRVWSVLTDFAAYPSWNPFVRRAEGKLVIGEKIRVEIGAPGSLAMKIKPRITQFEDGRRFAWRGSLIIPGLFDGEHRFELISIGPNQTRLIHAEQFRGVFVAIMKGWLEKSVRPGFVLMNEALKKRSEAQRA